MIEKKLDELELQIDQLIRFCKQLAYENERLHDAQQNLIFERDELLSKNHSARSKIESMLQRLKQLEAATHE